MIQDTLRENAPSRDTRFVEMANLLRRITDRLEQDPRVVAAYLDPFGANEGFGVRDAADAWSLARRSCRRPRRAHGRPCHRAA